MKPQPYYAMDVHALHGVADRPISPAAMQLWSVLSLASAAASGYHGYKRNQSVGWAVGWFILGGAFPVITPVIAVAQGFGKRVKK